MAVNFSRLEDITRALKCEKQSGQCFHTTFIYHGSKLLSIGMNDYTKSHKHLRYGKYNPTRDNHNNYKPAIHSEISALMKLGVEDCSHLTIYNLRIDNNGNPAISYPCVNCLRVLREQVGFKNLWYYDGEKYVKEKY